MASTPDGSFLSTDTPESAQNQHPLMDLERICGEDPSVRADVLLCPGDLTNNALPAPLKYSWDKLQQVAGWFEAPSVIATVGNHDVVSRGYVLDKSGTLKGLVPAFPGSNADPDKFWAQHFCVINDPAWRIVLLNSCAYHGVETEKDGIRKQEYESGRIEQPTLDALIAEIKQDSKAINVLVCHHHPLKQAEHDLGEHDQIVGGQLLLDSLASGLYGRWLVIHGHKHHPKLQYGPGGAAAPIVFSAGSFSKKLYPELNTYCRNQFYLLELHENLDSSPTMMGTFRSWTWRHGSGWFESVDREGLPPKGGFGYDCYLPDLVQELDTWMATNTAEWRDVLQHKPSLQYMIPSDLQLLRQGLAARGVQTEMQEGVPVRFIRR